MQAAAEAHEMAATSAQTDPEAAAEAEEMPAAAAQEDRLGDNS